MRKYLFLLAFAYFAATEFAVADTVTPTSEVTTRVIVRADASASAAEVGSLHPGESAELLGSVPRWHRVRLANGTVGFVAKRWTKVVSAGPAPAAAAASYK